MIGGLHTLVGAMKELTSEPQSKELTSRVLLADLAVHIVQALSAAIFMHGMSIIGKGLLQASSCLI